MTIQKKDLQEIRRDSKTLERKMEKLLREFEKERKAKTGFGPRKSARSPRTKKSFLPEKQLQMKKK
jgi:hypothetical protein